MKCARCGEESGNLFCGKCRADIMKRHNLVALMFYDKAKEGYRAGCSVLECPNNEYGVCMTVHKKISDIYLHEYDGDNCVKVSCG